MGKPLTVDVCIPCVHAHLQYLPECLKCLSGQLGDGDNVYVALSEDPSLNKTIAEFIRFPIKVKLLSTSCKVLAGENRNRAMAAGSGDILMFIDADDHTMPNKVRRVREEFEKYPEAAFVLHGQTGYGTHGKGSVRIDKGSQICMHCNGNCHLGHVSVRRSCFLPFPNLPVMEDEQFCLNLIHAGYTGRLIRQPLMTYNFRRSVMTRRFAILVTCAVVAALLTFMFAKWRIKCAK